MAYPKLSQQVEIDEITQEQLDPLVADYESEKFRAGLTPAQDKYRAQIAELFKAPEILQQASADEIVGQIIQQGNRIGGVDDITARASRDILRLKGERLNDKGIDEIFNAYKIKLPPTTDIKFQDYDNLDDEHEKIDGWAAQAKAAYNLKTKARHPELLAYRDEVFQKVDDAAKGLKERVGSTESGTLDFLGRLGQGVATFLDSVNLDDTADFVRKHVSTNPEWDQDTSSVIGQALGQGAAMLGAFAAAPAIALAAGASAPLVGAATVLGIGMSNLNATQKQRRDAVLAATGSENLAEETADTTSAYLEAGIDTLIDTSLLGMGRLGAGKLAKKFIGMEGRNLVGKGLAESLERTAGSLENLKRIAGSAGDIVFQGTKEGATEALQGAISDTSIGSYTNMRDQFDPYDVRNRAADFIGGFAGGAGISTVNNYFLPKDKLTPPPAGEAPIENRDNDIRESGAAFVTANTVEEAAIANLNFLDAATNQQVDAALAGETVDLPRMPDLAPDVPDTSFNFSNLYTGMKESLGDMINHPKVQEVAEGLVDMFGKVRAYEPSPRPKPEPAVEVAKPVTSVESPQIPTTAPITAAEETIEKTDNPEAPLAPFEKQLENFNSEVTALPGGGANYTFSLTSDGEQGNAAIIKNAVTTGKLDASTKDGTSIRGKDALRLNQNTYEVETDDAGTPTSFTTITPAGKRIIDTTVNTPERLSQRVEGILTRQKNTKGNLELRSRLGLTANKAYETAVPDTVTQALPEPAQRFVNTLFKTDGGNHALQQAKADQYVESGKAFGDLLDAGLSEDQAVSYLDKIRTVNDPEIRASKIDGKKNPKNAVRREAINSLHLDLAHSLLGRTGLEPAIRAGYSPDAQERVINALGYTGLNEDTVTPPGTAEIPGTQEAPDLSKNEEIQRRAIINRIGDEAQAEGILTKSRSNPEVRTAIEKMAGDYLAAFNIDPTDSLESAIEKADIRSVFRENRGAFKLRGNKLPLGRSLFGLGRVLKRAGIKYETSAQNTDFESVLPDDPLGEPLMRNTGRFNPQTGIRLASQILRGQQGAFTGWHELGEATLSGNADLANLFTGDTISASAQSLSNDIRDVPTEDPNEHVADVVSMYLYNKAGLTKTHPELVAALDAYAANPSNAGTTFVKAVNAVQEEDNIPDSQKLDEFSTELGEASAAASEALAARKEDKRPMIEKIKERLRDAHIRIYNSIVNLEEAADELRKSKSPLAQLGETFKVYSEIFKNRQQLALTATHTIKNAFTRMEQQTGVTREQINEFLGNNRILNEKAFWEQTIQDAKLTGEQFKDILYNSEGIKELLANDQELTDWIDVVTAGGGLADPDAVTTVLNELSAKAFANNSEKVIRQQLKKVPDFRLQAALSAAFDPTVTVGVKHPVDAIGNAGRGNLQNSANVNREVARAMLDNMRANMTPEQFAAMENFAKNVLAPMTRLAVNELHAVGAIDSNTAQFYLGNADNYVTFQLSDELQADPFVDAAMRRQEGMHGLRGAPLESTMLKVGGMRVRAAAQQFANSITDIYYALDETNKTGNIKPIAVTAARGPGTNTWAANNISKFEDGKIPEVTLKELLDKKTLLTAAAKRSGEDVSYIVSAQDGDYVLHEVTESTIEDVLNPNNTVLQNKTLQVLNNMQTWKRAILTTNNPAFAVRSIQRSASNLFKNRQPNRAQPTWTELGKAIWQAPIGGIPLNAADRQLMWFGYKEALRYTKNMGDPSVTLGSMDQYFGAGTTLQDLMSNPAAIPILVRQGLLPASIEEDLSSGVPSAISGQLGSSIFAPSNEGSLDNFIRGRAKQRNILERAAEYIPSTTGKSIAQGVAKSVDNYLRFVRNLNNSLELGEKYMGLLAYMQDGIPFNEAIELANLNYGNPDARGGGSNKALISPFILYSTSTLNSMRVVGNALKGARNPLQDQRVARAVGIGARNRLVMAALPGAVYALAKATGSDDDDAEDQANVIDRLITNIPEADRQNGLAIPFGFRDPRTGDIHLPLPSFLGAIPMLGTGFGKLGLRASEIDPSWTTAYLSLPYDHATGVFQSVTGLVGDLFTSNVGTSAMASNFLSSSLGQMFPQPGPLIGGGINAVQMSRGLNPVDLFTAQPAVSDEDYQKGGLQLGAKYVQHLLNEFVPLIPGPGKSPFDKTKIFEPTGYSVLDALPAMLKFGIVKDSNFGQIQQNRRQLGTQDQYINQVKEDISDDVKNYLNRTNELQREATRQLQTLQNELLSRGESPKNAVKRAADLLPDDTKMELIKAQQWRRQMYDTLVEKAEIALRAGDKAEYRQFIKDLDASLVDAE